MSKRWHSVPLRTHRAPQPPPTRTTNAPVPAQADVDEDEDGYAVVGHMGAGARQRQTDDADLIYTGPGNLGSITRRYQDRQGNTIIERGDRRYILHTEQARRVTEPGAQPRPGPARRSRVSGLLVFGLGMLAMIALVTIGSAIYNHQQAAAQQDAFEHPIITEQFAVVDHNHDSAARPSYFAFVNLQGRVLIIELPAGDPSKAMIYTGPTILGDNAYTQQVSGEFRDVNGDGRLDLIVSIGGQQQITYLNNGTKFVPQQP